MTTSESVDLRKPLIVQSDHTILVEVDTPDYAEARDTLARFPAVAAINTWVMSSIKNAGD